MKSLGEFIVEKQAEYPHARGSLSGILAAIRLAAKVINRDINRAGLVHEILGDAGAENVQGEQQKKLDVFAHKTIIDVNVSVGTIFSIYRRVTPVGTPVTLEDFLQPGRAQVAAGYVVYGSSTMLVYTTGNGVNGFTYDPGIGVFALSHENIRIPEDGKIYSVNEGQYLKFPQGVKKYIKYCQEDRPSEGLPLTSRYIGSLVSDFHRNMLKGGIYMYPQGSNYPKGKLRLLYECNPMAFLAEQAGGMATDGEHNILDIQPTELHQRSPFFVGSKKMVEKVHDFIRKYPD